MEKHYTVLKSGVIIISSERPTFSESQGNCTDIEGDAKIMIPNCIPYESNDFKFHKDEVSIMFWRK
ncbi:MAG: hypothetical protein JST04_00970 [Bdellovibrionales bacterium]|nr:hypothetical protein [Bdellovibrionales bacterium]